MRLNEELSIVESILFASGDPVEKSRLAQASGIEEETIEKIINMLNDRYEENESALMIIKLSDSYQLCVREKFIDYIRAAMETRKAAPLSPAAIFKTSETLKIGAQDDGILSSFKLKQKDDKEQNGSI